MLFYIILHTIEICFSTNSCCLNVARLRAAKLLSLSLHITVVCYRVSLFAPTVLTMLRSRTCVRAWGAMSVPTLPVPTPSASMVSPTVWSVTMASWSSIQPRLLNGGWHVTSRCEVRCSGGHCPNVRNHLIRTENVLQDQTKQNLLDRPYIYEVKCS